FSVAPDQPAGQWRNLLEGMVCACGLNGRMRLILKVIDELLPGKRVDQALVLERMTPLFPCLQARIPSLRGAEFLGTDIQPGAAVRINKVAVQHEDMCQLSLADSTLDLLMHFDVLEHVPDATKGLRECVRVLRRDGVLVFSCPF